MEARGSPKSGETGGDPQGQAKREGNPDASGAATKAEARSGGQEKTDGGAAAKGERSKGEKALFVLASLLGGVSGLLIGPVTTVYYDSGFLIGLKAFVAAIVGGLGSYPLTAVGAVGVGILESFASYWSSSLKESIVFGILIPVLLWRSLIRPQNEEEEEEIE